jgi:pimeloyl-ACP methyl ester carboxylesterase
MSTVEVVTLSGSVIEYRVVAGSDRAVVIMHGGHMHAGIELGEQVFRELGYTVVVPSRPGYGQTPIVAGGDRNRFADHVAELIRHLGCRDVAAVVGISAGGPWAIALASRHRDLVQRVVLQNSVSDLEWPDRATRVAARLAFGARVERLTWAITRCCLRIAPVLTLRGLMFPLTTRPSRRVVSEFSSSERDALVHLFCNMRSGNGFGLDLRTRPSVAELESVTQPCLVVASAHDGSVEMEHAESLATHLRDATLSINQTSSHLMWFGPSSDSIPPTLQHFLSE